MRLIAAAAAASLLTLPVLTASPAAALSCVETAEVVSDARHVVTGRIVDARDGTVLVDVEEVWTDRPVADRLWLTVYAEGWSEWAEGGREIPDGFTTREAWVFALGDEPATGPCSAWRADSDLLAGLRPAVVHPPVAQAEDAFIGAPAPSTSSTGAVVAIAGAGVGAATLAGLLLVRRRRRTAREGAQPA